MSHFDYDLLVIGAGSGGVRAARMAASKGARVALAEQDRIGGTCVNRGCVPKKLYVYAAELATAGDEATGFGWALENHGFDWDRLQRNKDQLIASLNQRMERMLREAGVALFSGRARIVDPHQVIIGHSRYHAERILVTTGSQPYLPEIPGKELLQTSDQVFTWQQLPETLLIVGGGYIATEFAGIFHRLGVQVTQIYRGELFLQGFDEEIRQFVADAMRRRGLDLRFMTNLTVLEEQGLHSYRAYLGDGEDLTVDQVLCAIGRRPRVAEIGLEEVGVLLNERGAVTVNEHYQTSVPSIYALGDVIDGIQLTPVALAQAMALVEHLFGGQSTRPDNQLIPTAVFSQPQFASVGLNEEDACRSYQRVDVYSTTFQPLKHGLTGSGEQTLIKLLVNADSDQVVGAHMAGEGAAETIQGLAIALQSGASKSDFDRTLGIHPTSAEEFVTLRTPTRRHGHSKL